MFHEGGFETVSVERLDALGSDPFPYLARLCRRTGASADPFTPPDADDVAAANATLTAAGASERVRLPTDR
ncbi:hypothetical protein ASF22_20840 [Methylobacterium sp. Leaf87]|nr:hypothetical protein ASF22_20840 [Methylobacterium sp. Leaf87]